MSVESQSFCKSCEGCDAASCYHDCSNSLLHVYRYNKQTMSAAPKKLRDCDQQQRDATLMVATARNAVAAQIDQSHSPGGANVHPT